MMTLTAGNACALAAIAILAGCVGRQPQPTGAPERVVAVDTTVPPRRYVDADVRFMQHMIEHHGQALHMTDLVPERASSETVRLMAERIEVSQRDEIGRMRRWLVERGEDVPAVGAGHHHDAPADSGQSMPGMLSTEELTRLEAARGSEFDRLFLEYMIRHHEGALVMVAELFATDGAGQELDIFRFASDVDADQRAEIRRMQSLLEQHAGRQARP